MVSGTGMPRFWATVYQITYLAELKDSTVARRLNAIDAFYRFAADFHGHEVVDQYLYDINIDGLAQLLEAFFNAERNRAAQNQSDLSKRWAAVKAFVFIMADVSAKAANDARLLGCLKADIAAWQTRYRNFSINPRPVRIHTLRALPAAVIEEIYALFEPESIRNPFRSKMQRWRNYCILLAMLHQGLRRGEALLLPVNSIKSGIDERTLSTRHWINVQHLFEDDDPRFCDPPSIKNAQSIRQIPISAELANIFQAFIANYRGKSPYPQLFLNSQREPLGTRGLSKIFQIASQSLSPAARQTLIDNMRTPTITSHDLRHTCAVIRLAHLRASGIPEEESLQKLRAFFGWSYTSIMPRLYARAYWERHIADVWHDQFDAHVEALRSLEHGYGRRTDAS